MRRTPIKTGTQLNFPVLRIGDFFCVFLCYQIVINCVFSYFNWVITQIRSLIKVLNIRLKLLTTLNILCKQHCWENAEKKFQQKTPLLFISENENS